MQIKAVCFDLYSTLAYVAEPVSDKSASDFLVSRGYEVYPQALHAAWQYVSFVDYPKYGSRNWSTQIQRVLQRLSIKADKETLTELARLYESAKWTRFPDVEDAVKKAKKLGLRTAIVTTIARFKFKEALRPILTKIDVLADGYTFHCEKSNPRIYLKTLEALNVDASEAVMVGDDMDLDIRLPKRLGMKAILLDRAGQSFSQQSGLEADSVVKEPERGNGRFDRIMMGWLVVVKFYLKLHPKRTIMLMKSWSKRAGTIQFFRPSERYPLVL